MELWNFIEFYVNFCDFFLQKSIDCFAECYGEPHKCTRGMYMKICNFGTWCTGNNILKVKGKRSISM